VIWTTPWDSYLIHQGIWTYPAEVIIGPTLFRIPIEEIFFFCIQTYIGTCLHILLNKPVLLPTYLHRDADLPAESRLNYHKRLGQIFFAFGFVVPLLNLNGDKEATYMRLISIWASPVLYLLWSLAYQLLAGLPNSKTILAINLTTLYLWIVDTFALRRGTWSIESGTKLGINLWPINLEMEEAIFFLATNTLIVFGSCAFDNSIAILDAFPDIFPRVPTIPSPVLMIKSLLVPTFDYDGERLKGLRNALAILSKKSRSFYLASGVFSGRLRIDLVLLYAYCRVADDLIDNAGTTKEAEQWLRRLSHFLDIAYSSRRTEESWEAALSPFPEVEKSILALLPTDRLPVKPLRSLLDGFRTDLDFARAEDSSSTRTRNSKPPPPPIQTEKDLENYGTRVASTVAELCLHLVYFHDPSSKPVSGAKKSRCLSAGRNMGVVLQYINVVRDVQTDAETGRCYIPADWFDDPKANSSPEAFKAELLRHRQRILDTAFELYEENRLAIEDVPEYARGGIRVAVESYVEIGRVMREKLARGEPLDMAGGGKAGRASVSTLRRLWVGWAAMGAWRFGSPRTSVRP
jgi:15-cis-phytoene synthase / lycopene beta-cyclase